MPIDGPNTRLLRTGLLAKELAERGHEVTYWNASFNHQLKVQRYKQTTIVRQNNLYDCVFLNGIAYKKNISIARIRSQMQNAYAFRIKAPTMPLPDIILCGLPTIELAHEVSKFATKRNIPFILDARDMWPDVIETHLTFLVKLLAFPMLVHWRARRDSAFENAKAIVGISTSFVAWGAACANRASLATDRAFHLAGDLQVPDIQSMVAARLYWEDVLGPIKSAKPVLLMAGNLSARVDILTAVKAATQATNGGEVPYTLVVCGKGDLENEIANIAKNTPSVVYAGWRSGAELKALSERAAGGVLAYSNTLDLMAGFPNKIGEYLSFGLPIITCLKGETERLLGCEGVIIPYHEGNIKSARSAFEAAIVSRADKSEKALDCFSRYFDSYRIYKEFAEYIEKIVLIQPLKNVSQ
jgi:glycosyltransferase involved in cell wall biosynthesis